MKILHLVQKQQLRGAEVFTSQLSGHLQKCGHQAVIVPVFGGNAKLPFDGKIIELHGDPRKKYWDLKAWKALAQIIKFEQPDLIQANAGDTLKYAIFSKLLFRWRQPVIFRNASTISLYIRGGFVKKLYRFLFNNTDQIISVSQTSAADFAALYPECKNKINVVPIGIEQSAAVENKMFQNPFKSFSVNGPVLVHVGGFTFEKNHEGLIRIFQKIVAQMPSATLHLVGDGPLRKETEKLVQQANLSDQVFFHGFQKEPLSWIQFADALLLPSLIEGLPGVILEAFYCKTPVVAYNTGGIHEIVAHNQTGCLLPKGDEAAFADATVRLIRDKEASQKMIQNAFALVVDKYLNTQVVKGFLNIYQKLCPHKEVQNPITSVTEF